MSKPSIVVVPGAHHVPEHFSKVTTILERSGYKVVPVRLPIPGDKLPPGVQGNVKVIRQAVEREVQAGNDVLLVLHSASGATGPAAIEGLTKEAGSTKPGVIRILAFAAHLTPPGKNLIEVIHGQTCQWLKLEGNSFVVLPYDEPGAEPTKPGAVTCSPPTALYNDFTEQQKREAYDLLVPIYADSFAGRFDYAGWQHIPVTYVYLENDKALFPEVQREIVHALGVKVEERSLNTSHTPFISAPRAVADLIEEAASI